MSSGFFLLEQQIWIPLQGRPRGLDCREILRSKAHTKGILVSRQWAVYSGAISWTLHYINEGSHYEPRHTQLGQEAAQPGLLVRTKAV